MKCGYTSELLPMRNLLLTVGFVSLESDVGAAAEVDQTIVPKISLTHEIQGSPDHSCSVRGNSSSHLFF